MTGDKKWFSSLALVKEKMYITFGDNGQGRVMSEGVVHVSDKVLNISIRPLMCPLKMESWKRKIGLFVRWLGRCSMSTGLLGGIGLRRSIRLVMFPTGFYYELSRRRPVMSLCMVGHPR
jgi:hypothetical protein